MGELQAKKAQPISVWLDVLSAVIPPRGVLVVGAGAGNGLWVQWLRHSGVCPVWLVEGDKGQYQHLLGTLPSGENWALRRDVVAAASADKVVFHRASNPSESGLVAPERLRGLWPNLESVGAEEAEAAVTLDALFAEAEGDINWLVLDCLPAAHLLQGGAQLLHELDVVLVRVVVDENFTTELDARHEAVDELLHAAGLTCIRFWPGRHPALAHALYVRDTVRLATQLKQALADVYTRQQCMDELVQALQAVRQQLDEQTQVYSKAVEQARAEADKREAEWHKRQDAWQQEKGALLLVHEQASTTAIRQAQAQKKSVDELTQTLQAVRQQLDEQKQAYAKAVAQARAEADNREAEWHKLQVAWQQEKAELMARGETLSQEKAQFEKLAERSDVKLEKLGKAVETSIHREIANAVKQIEAFSNLQGYLTSGVLMPALHGWPVSPDFALLLVKLLEQHSFDAIIEFGSGSSTLLIAHTLAHLVQKHPQRSRPVQVAFEHLEEYHASTGDLLAGAGLRDEVMLLLAPLKPTVVASGDAFNYYDPGDTLVQVAQRLGGIDAPRILAIVDGPPESTGPLARYPALEMLLEAFPRQQGFLLVDDYRRPGEQEIARRWQELLKNRDIEPQVTEYELEKMACLIRFESSTLAVRSVSAHIV